MRPTSTGIVDSSHHKKAPASVVHLFYHLHPAKIPAAALDIRRTYGLGGMCLVLLIILAFSGSLMLFAYTPVPGEAYASVQGLENNYIFGKFIRSLHYFSANLLVIICTAHMFRVFFTQCFHRPRQFNWIIGLCLCALILLACFTGYLLPWDQTAYWAVTICLSMFDYLPFPMDLEVSSNTLKFFFALHTTLVPFCLLVLLPLHFWKIRKARGIGLPEKDATDHGPRVSVRANLLLREGVTALVLTALVAVTAALFETPLGDMANPGLSPNPAKAPWYFAGLQEILLHVPPLVGILAVPLVLLAFFSLIPYFKYSRTSPSLWFISQNGKTSGWISFFFSTLAAIILILAKEYGKEIGLPGTHLIPLLFFIGGAACIFWLKKQFRLNANELLQALFIQIISLYLTLTLINTVFRGEGMKLSGGFF